MRKQLGVTEQKLENKGYLSVLNTIFKNSHHMLDHLGYGLCEQLEWLIKCFLHGWESTLMRALGFGHKPQFQSICSCPQINSYNPVHAK